jgi:hypothetical protein
MPEAQEDLSSEPALENEFYRVLFDRRTGGILSLIDKADGRELVDPLSPYTLNSLVYAAGGGSQSSLVQKHYAPADLRTMTSTGASFSKRSLPGLGEEMIVRSRGPFMPEIKTTVTLWTHVKRVDFLDRVTKDLTYEKEAVYFAFPFNAPRPTVRIEIPNGELRADLDMLPGGCRDWYCTQHWVRIENEAGAILWTSPDAPLLCLEDIFRGLWREKLELKSGHLFSYAMNNYWHTNYKAGQEGEFEFRYALTSGKTFSSSESARFGWQAAMPLGHAFISKGQEGPVRESSESFCTVEPENVFVTALKAPDSGPGVILRLMETAGQEGTAELKLPLLGKIEKAELCTLIEEPLSELEVKGKRIQVPFKGKAILTIRVVPES